MCKSRLPIALLLIGLLSVCSIVFAQPESEDRFGGTFNAAVTATPPTLDVMTSTAAATRQATWFFLEPLITYDENYEPIPLLAEGWEVSDDGLTYTVDLKQGVKFHNGEEMTSEDVVASIERFLEVSPRASSFELLESYEAIDPYTIQFTLSEPSASFIDALAYPVAYMAVMPKDIIEGKGVGELTAEDMVGTGPYKLASFRPDEVVELVRFDEYHTTDGETSGLGGNKTPYFDEVNLILVPEAGARVAGLETGEYDFAQDLPFTEYERLRQSDEIQAYVLQPERWTVIDFNYCEDLPNSLAFRKAVQAALDMNAIGAAQAGGIEDFYRVQPSIFFTESPWYTEVAAEFYNQNDLEAAKSYLEESGYQGEEIVMLTNRNYDYMFKTIMAAANQLERNLGLNVRVEILDWPAQRALWKQSDGWHMDVTGFLSQASFAPDAFGSIYHSTSDRKCHSNPQLDNLFEAASAAETTEERQAIYDEIQQTFYEDVTAIKTVDLFGLHGLRSDIEGFEPWYNVTRFWNVWRE